MCGLRCAETGALIGCAGTDRPRQFALRLDSSSHQRVPSPVARGAAEHCVRTSRARRGIACPRQLLCDFAIDYAVKMCYRIAILAREGPSPETILQAERGVASIAARKAVNEKPGAVARHEQWLAASSLPAGSADSAGSGAVPGPTTPRWSAERRCVLVCAGRPTPRKREVAPYGARLT